MSVWCVFRSVKNYTTMKYVAALLGVLFLAVTADAGASMHNPFYCYATDPIRPMTNMASTITSYEAIRRFNFTTVNPYRSSKAFSNVLSTVEKMLKNNFFSLCSVEILVLGTIRCTFPTSSCESKLRRLLLKTIFFNFSVFPGNGRNDRIRRIVGSR